MAMQDTVINVFDTVSQGDGFLVEIPENAWIQNRYFKSSPRTEFFSKKLVLDFDSEDLKAGAWVRKGYVTGETTKFRATAIEPPRIGVQDTIDPSDNDRQLFEQLCYEMGSNGSNHVEALENLKRVKVMRLGQRVSRSIEKVCCQVLLDNAVRGTMATSPTDSTPVEIEIKFYDDSTGKGNPQRYVPAHPWDSTEATPYRDIVKMCVALKQHGGKPKEVLLSPEAWICLRNDPILEKYVSWYHSEGSSVGGGEDGDAERVARVVFDGYALDVIVYSGMYENADGEMVSFLPKDFVCVLSPDCGRLFTAGVTMLNPQSVTVADPMDASSFIPRRGKFIASQYVDLKAQELSLQVESKPLPAPKKDWQWITMLANNTNGIADGVVGAASDIGFELKAATEGVTLPADMTNLVAGSSASFKIPTATNGSLVVDVYLGDVKIESNKAQGADVTFTVPQESDVITLDYHVAG